MSKFNRLWAEIMREKVGGIKIDKVIAILNIIYIGLRVITLLLVLAFIVVILVAAKAGTLWSGTLWWY